MTPLLWVGATSSWLFIVIFLLDGWTRPGYQPFRHPVSALALGSRGWIQTTNFIVCGSAITTGAIALSRPLDTAVLALVLMLFGASLVASGVFPMDAMRGYPPGTPDGTPTEVSTRHKLHDSAGAVVFGSLPIAAVIAVVVVPETAWKWYSAVTAAALAAGAVAFSQAWERDSAHVGLIQRTTIIIGWVWLGLLFASTAA